MSNISDSLQNTQMSSSTIDIIGDDKVAIALLKEAGKHHDFRLMKLENKFDKLQENINLRFDKFEEVNEQRRKEMIEFQKEIAHDIKITLERTERNETNIKNVERKTEQEITDIKTEVANISSLKLKLFGAIATIGFLITLFGKEIFKIFFNAN